MVRALWHAAVISGLFLYSPARRTRARGVRARMQVSVAEASGPESLDGGRGDSGPLVDQWDTLAAYSCDYASIVVHHRTIER